MLLWDMIVFNVMYTYATTDLVEPSAHSNISVRNVDVYLRHYKPAAYRGGVGGSSTPPPEIPKF